MKRLIKRLMLILMSVSVLAFLLGISVFFAWFGDHEPAGKATEAIVPPEVIAQRAQQTRQAGGNDTKQILFGDLHVHTNFSWDGFMMSLPIVQGGGPRPPSNACDYARFCSGLDFWAISDHAESLSPRHWKETRESIRQCNAISGDESDPDSVAFLGWEWSHRGVTAKTHYGHKNVLFLDTENDATPARPIASRTPLRNINGLLSLDVIGALSQPRKAGRYSDHAFYARYLAQLPVCPDSVKSPSIKGECIEIAPTASDLFRKLDEWGMENIVIPHGNAWGMTSPWGTDFANELANTPDAPQQNLVEVFSGHGNSEEYRQWQDVTISDSGQLICPQPQDGYIPDCHRAGEIIENRCLAAGLGIEECTRRRDETRSNFLRAPRHSAFATVPGAQAADWGLSGQCTDCYMPSFFYSPNGSTQYALAITHFDKNQNKRRFRFGMIGSSDNHRGSPGTGYKDFMRNYMTDTMPGPRFKWQRQLFLERARGKPAPAARPADKLPSPAIPELQGSYLYTGGLVATHAENRSRTAIWAAMKRREVYATSGPRMLLWFDLLNSDGAQKPMGSQVEMDQAPLFRVRAAGALRQKPGCPQFARQALGEERLAQLCFDECYNPGEERLAITRIEVVRIRPQSYPGEPVAALIEDPWRVFYCGDSEHEAGTTTSTEQGACELQFHDPDHATGKRDSVYYARAIQEPTPSINGVPAHCKHKAEDGSCAEFKFCDVQENPYDNCLSMSEERAWSSPIFVDYQR